MAKIEIPERIEQLTKITDMIALCERYLKSDHKTLHSEACTWLDTLRVAAEHRIEIRTKTIRRLNIYRLKKAFDLYLALLAESVPSEEQMLENVSELNEVVIGGIHCLA